MNFLQTQKIMEKLDVNSQSKQGFTLVELLVAVAIFSLIVGGVVNILSSTFAVQRRSLASQELVGQTSFVAEFMSRALRQAQKEFSAPTCLSGNGDNYELFDADTRIRFIDRDGDCREFYEDGGKIKERDVLSSTESDLTSADLTVQTLKFYISGESQSDNLQPRATFYMAIEGRDANKPLIRLQSTISQRRYDVPE